MRCPRCKTNEIEIKGGAYCRPCRKAVNQERYERDPEAHKARVRLYKQRRLAELREYLVNYFIDHPCVDCGEHDLVVLEFDHVRGEKIANVSTLVNQCSSFKRVQDEIAKCDVVCANCHRRRESLRGQWWSVTV